MSTSAIAKLRPVLVTASSKHTATVIFLHGSGDTGDGIRSWIQLALGGNHLSFPHIRLIYPSAPMRPYTPNMGMPSSVWFDRKQVSPMAAEDLPSIDTMCADINALVDQEVKNGISRDRIIIGGFSMGGAMAMYYGLRKSGLRGVFTLSSFLNENSVVYESLKTETLYPKMFMCHGGKDPLVDLQWGKRTFDNLKSLGVEVEFHKYDNLFHELNRTELTKLREWINATIPNDQ